MSTHTNLIPEYFVIPSAQQIVKDINGNLPPHVAPVRLCEIEEMLELAHMISATPADFLRNINWLICLTYDRHCD